MAIHISLLHNRIETRKKNIVVLYFKVLYNKDYCTVLWVKSKIVTTDVIFLQGDE